MNAVICDDNPIFTKHLSAAISDCCAKRDRVCECRFCNSAAELLSMDLSSVQALFLDIDMPGQNGLEAARVLRKSYPEMIIVFVTGFIEYAPDGYDVNAFRYLLKPELQTRLPKCLDDIWEKLYETEESIRVKLSDHSEKLRLRDILFLEGTTYKHVLIHTLVSPQEPLRCIGSLADYEENLRDKGFLRIQKSFLVNMAHLEDIRNYRAILDCGPSLRVSRTNYADICERFVLWEGQRL